MRGRKSVVLFTPMLPIFEQLGRRIENGIGRGVLEQVDGLQVLSVKLAKADLVLAVPQPQAAATEATLSAAFDASVVLGVGLCATLSSDTAAVGDVVVPAIMTALTDMTAVTHRRTQRSVSGSVLQVARELAGNPWYLDIEEPRPARVDERPRVRFGDVAESETLTASVDSLTRARGLALVAMETSEIGTHLPSDIAFGLVLGVSDDASAEKSAGWRRYAVGSVSAFALRLAIRLGEAERPDPRSAGLATLLPRKDISAGTSLFRSHHGRFEALDVHPHDGLNAHSFLLQRRCRSRGPGFTSRTDGYGDALDAQRVRADGTGRANTCTSRRPNCSDRPTVGVWARLTARAALGPSARRDACLGGLRRVDLPLAAFH
jgi:nucleoside phosphorylase